MYNDQGLEADCPGRVAQTLFQCAEDLGDSGLAARRGQEDVFDIFGLGRRKLWTKAVSELERWVGAVALTWAYLDLGAAFDRLLDRARHWARVTGRAV